MREHPARLFIEPAACLRALPENERSYIHVPEPHWMAKDPLRKSFSRYGELWFGGEVVWGRVVQANNALFSTGEADSPGDVIYDPSGSLGPDELVEPAHRLFALKGTHPTDKPSRDFADHLTNECTRVCGMPVPVSISHHPLRVSTVLFH